MFEGTERWMEDAMGGWWLAWFLWCFALAMFRRVQPQHWRSYFWAWSDVNLLVQEKGESLQWTLNEVLGTALAALSFGLAFEGLWSVSTGTHVDWWQAGTGAVFWMVLAWVRRISAWIMGFLMDGGKWNVEWWVTHRYALDSMGFMLAGLGIVCVHFGSQAASIGLWAAFVLWALGWILRMSRVVRNGLGKQLPLVLVILYLCGLEILPVAVLFRAWQGH